MTVPQIVSSCFLAFGFSMLVLGALGMTSTWRLAASLGRLGRAIASVAAGLLGSALLVLLVSFFGACAPVQIPTSLYAPIDATEYAACELIPMPALDEASFVAGCEALWTVLDNELNVPTDAGLFPSSLPRAGAPTGRWIVRTSSGVVLGYYRTQALAKARAARKGGQVTVVR